MTQINSVTEYALSIIYYTSKTSLNRKVQRKFHRTNGIHNKIYCIQKSISDFQII